LSEKTEVETSLVLPQGSDCEACLGRLQQALQRYRAVEVAHLDRDGNGTRLCIHYDPAEIEREYIQAIVAEEGAILAWRYRHETLPVEGMDCADCARTLEAGITRLDGVLSASVNFAAETLAVEYDAERVARPAILNRVRALGYDVAAPAAPAEMLFHVDGLDCADCALHLEEALRRTPGVSEVSLNFSLARLRVVPEAGAQVIPAVERVAREMGHSLQPERSETEDQAHAAPDRRQWLRRHRRDLATAVSGLLILLAVAASLLGLAEPVVAGLYVAAIAVGGFYVARAGWAALRTAHSLDMNALMAIAAIGSIFVAEWAEGAVAMFLFSLGNTLEGYTMDRARNAIRGLMDLSPRRATLIHGNEEKQVPVEELRIGDRILVHPGERLPIDGVVLAGQSAVNQAPVTGESVPVDKGPGDQLFGGTVNGQGALTVRVTHLAADSTIARIIKMVEEAQAQKAPSQRFVDRFAKIYTPAVIAIAAAVALLPPLAGWLTGAFSAPLGDWFYRALVLLVIACPCALVISTPVSIVSAIASAARAGVLIKGGAYLETLGALKVIAFDKTGTLTEGRPQLVDVRCADHQAGRPWAECPTCRHLLTVAASVERHSEHPLARAVVQAAEAQGLASALLVAQEVQAVAGRGVRGVVDGERITVGDHTYAHQATPQLAHLPMCDAIDAAQAAGQTAMVISDDSHGILGYILVADRLRPGVPAMIGALKKIGIEHTVMLTGDNEATAQAIAAAAQVDEVRAGLLPDQKVAAVEALLASRGAVAMVGDGVNDAPALARASVGIAMGAAGTDTALENADVALMADDLSKLPFAVKLSRRARAIIGQNIALSLGIKAIFLALAVAGVATLWMAVFADMGTSLLVTFNGMRLLRHGRTLG
jgi:Cd2+/Zn2+-exporting ATPase